MAKFKIEDPRTGENVLGASVSGENVYIAVYARPLVGEKHPRLLAVFESTMVVYNLSGERGVYRVTRLEDEILNARAKEGK